jgi:hypothetical protein
MSKGIERLILAFITLVLFMCFMWLTTGCSSNAYHWRDSYSTGIEKYERNRPAWGGEHGCSTYYTRQPVKQTTQRRFHYFPKHVKQ